MATGNFTNPKMQARYIDETISDLNLKLAYPGSIFRSSRILHTEQTLEEIIAENEEIWVNVYHVILKLVICCTL
jgi:hypothetical protein